MENIILQAGVIPFKQNNNDLEIMLITSRNKKKWIFPKGFVENGDSLIETAEKEALEEAGIIGKIIEKSIGVYKYKKWGSICSVEIFPFKVDKVTDQWLEGEFRKRMWFDIESAISSINKKELKNLLKKFYNNKERILDNI